MADDVSVVNDTAQKLHEMERQAACLAQYLRRGDIESARWLLGELKAELCHVGRAALDDNLPD